MSPSKAKHNKINALKSIRWNITIKTMATRKIRPWLYRCFSRFDSIENSRNRAPKKSGHWTTLVGRILANQGKLRSVAGWKSDDSATIRSNESVQAWKYRWDFPFSVSPVLHDSRIPGKIPGSLRTALSRDRWRRWIRSGFLWVEENVGHENLWDWSILTLTFDTLKWRRFKNSLCSLVLLLIYSL